MFKLFVAAFIVRSTACAINDVFDRKFDAAVGMLIADYTFPPHVVIERTKGRPLASSRMSVFAAIVYLIPQYLAGVLLFLPYKRIAFWSAIAQLFPLYEY